MRVMIVAPNGGASLSTGGGSLFALTQAMTISRSTGAATYLAAYHSLSLPALASLHHLRLEGLRIRLVSSQARTGYALYRRSPLKLSAYNALLLPSFGRWIADTIDEIDPDWIWFHDDIPSSACSQIRGRRVALYVHYPLVARSSRTAPPLDESRYIAERVNDSLLGLLNGRIVCRSPSAHASAIWANSTVTARVVRANWGVQPEVHFPFHYAPASAVAEKHKLVLAIGAYSKGKNYETLVSGFCSSGLALDGWRLVIAGTSRDGSYLRRIRRSALRSRDAAAISIMSDIDGSTRDRLLAESSIVVQPAIFEPFGIALAEGMANGAAAVAHAGPWSGSWIDLLDSGRYGMGFQTPSDLAHALRRLAFGELLMYQHLAAERIRGFDDSRFVAATLREFHRAEASVVLR